MTVSLKWLEAGCSEHSLNDYRRHAKRHLLYTPFVFSPQHYRIVSRDPLVTEPPLREVLPLAYAWTGIELARLIEDGMAGRRRQR